MTKRVYGYLRVSGKGQIEGDGPDRQRDAVTRFSAAHSLELVSCGFEAGVSGTVEGLERPEFARLMEICQTEGAGIVVERLDRLARDLMVQEVLLSECRKAGVPVFSVDHGELTDVASFDDDPTRKAFRQMAGVFAEWDKTSTVLKLRAARRRKKERTGRCEGRKPYGHTECERSVLDIMIERYCDFGTFGDVAEHLNGIGMKPRSGKSWNKGTVWAILRRHQDEIDRYKSEHAVFEEDGDEGAGQGEAFQYGQGGEFEPFETAESVLRE